MVTVAEVRTLQKEALDLAKELGLVVKELTDAELSLFARSFERQFVLPFVEREVANIYVRHMGEILLGAMKSKEQFAQELGGERPPAGKFGMVPIRPAFFGYRDWDEIGTITGGSPQNWIHAASTLLTAAGLGGTAGNAISIEENAAHVLVGVGSLHPSPKIESIQLTIDGKTKPVAVSWYNFGLGTRQSALKIKEFDTAFILKEDTTILTKVYQRPTGDDIPYLLGVSYIKEPQLRVHDPLSVVAATQKVLRV